MKYLFPATLICFLYFYSAIAEEKTVRVFVALCDNATQSIVKVNPRIGDGDNPDTNLYWGCSDGLPLYFKKSGMWKLVKKERDLSPAVLERATFQHSSQSGLVLVADAYRGSEMKQCLLDFMSAAADEDAAGADLVAFIGHNGLMDFRDLEFAPAKGNRDAIVLCCLSNSFFSNRLKAVGAEPVLLTKSLMYPGSFILHDVLEGWRRRESKAQLRERAAKAYARNQKISTRSARSVFAELK
ncbi:MAG: hypothetical protein P1V20_05685 [Verrucomicrobiales bacterium]|nr:hypothetical protein [Verrucomicrobiales bacterium]